MDSHSPVSSPSSLCALNSDKTGVAEGIKKWYGDFIKGVKLSRSNKWRQLINFTVSR